MANIQILYGVEGAQEAAGTVVIVDVFRAATTAAYALSRGVQYIIPVAHRSEAFGLREVHPDYLLMGEHHGIKVKGFDYGNSPFELSKINLQDRIVVQRTSQGTRGLVNAAHADELIFGSFVTVSAIANHLQLTKPYIVSIVAMDGLDTEDDKFAMFLKEKIEGENPKMEPVIEYLRGHKASKRFLDPNIPGFDEEDFHLCLTLDTFNFFIRAERDSGQLILKSIYE